MLEDLELKRKGHRDFSGLSLESCRQLLGDWTTERDRIHAQLREMIFLRDHLILPEFELSSMGTVFTDSITNDLLKETSKIALQLKDGNNRTSRDYERMQDTLSQHKQFLAQHLFETIELLKLRGRLLGEKIGGLRTATLRLLRSEKNLLMQKVEGFQEKMQGLPEKWRKENQLSLKKELGMRMVEGMSQLSELRISANTSIKSLRSRSIMRSPL